MLVDRTSASLNSHLGAIPAMQINKVLVTGASGLIGGLVLKNLGHKYEFSAVNRRKVEGIPCTQASIADFDAILPAFEGIDAVLHLAAHTAGNDWEQQLNVDIGGTYNVYEAARRNGVKRVVYASSGGTMLSYETESPYYEIVAAQYDKIPDTWPMITHESPVRPNDLVYVAKVCGEVIGRYFSDRFDMSSINIRVGAVLPDDKPTLRRHYPGYLSHADCVQMIDKCLSAPSTVRYNIFDAISDNKYRWRATSHATEVLGWAPQGSAEDYEIEDKGGPHQVDKTFDLR